MNEDVFFRLAREEEKHGLEELQRRASLANPGDRDAILAHPDAIELPLEQLREGRVVVAEKQGVVVGFSAVLPRGDGQGELDGLFVEPSLWKSGLGRLLVDEASRLAKSFGAEKMHVVGNPQALTFYRKVGFQLVGKTETRFGIGWLLVKKL